MITEWWAAQQSSIYVCTKQTSSQEENLSRKDKKNKAAFQLELKNIFEALNISENENNEVNDNITSAIRETAEMIVSISANKKSKYSEVTMALIKKRKNIQVKTQRDEME